MKASVNLNGNPNVNSALWESIQCFDQQESIESAWTPEASWYFKTDYYELEKKTVFQQGWQFIGRSEQVREPGQFFSTLIADEPIVVLRDKKGKLQAFYNVCRHHAACIAQGEGKLNHLSCPYHGWTYDLNGELMAAPRLEGIKDFRYEDYSLIPIALEEWGSFLWINLSKNPSPFPLHLKTSQLQSRLDQAHLNQLRFLERKTYEIGCNWKVYIDNYLDGGYHVPVLHKQLSAQLDLKSYQTEIYEGYSIQSSRGASSDLRIGKEALYVWIYPNFMINRYGPVMDTNWVIPLSHERTLTVFDFYLDEKAILDVDLEKFVSRTLSESERVQQEDILICESVQKGMRSSAYVRGRYAPRLETSAFQFHKLLARQFLNQNRAN